MISFLQEVAQFEDDFKDDFHLRSVITYNLSFMGDHSFMGSSRDTHW